MPALGHTVRDACIFCRAHLNWWPSDIPADWLVITEADWRALADADSTALDPVAFAADVTPERSHAAIATAGLRCDGLGHVEVVDHRPDTRWVVGRLVELREKWAPCVVVINDTRPGRGGDRPVGGRRGRGYPANRQGTGGRRWRVL